MLARNGTGLTRIGGSLAGSCSCCGQNLADCPIANIQQDVVHTTTVNHLYTDQNSVYFQILKEPGLLGRYTVDINLTGDFCTSLWMEFAWLNTAGRGIGPGHFIWSLVRPPSFRTDGNYRCTAVLAGDLTFAAPPYTYGGADPTPGFGPQLFEGTCTLPEVYRYRAATDLSELSNLVDPPASGRVFIGVVPGAFYNNDTSPVTDKTPGGPADSDEFHLSDVSTAFWMTLGIDAAYSPSNTSINPQLSRVETINNSGLPLTRVNCVASVDLTTNIVTYALSLSGASFVGYNGTQEIRYIFPSGTSSTTTATFAGSSAFLVNFDGTVIPGTGTGTPTSHGPAVTVRMQTRDLPDGVWTTFRDYVFDPSLCSLGRFSLYCDQRLTDVVSNSASKNLSQSFHPTSGGVVFVSSSLHFDATFPDLVNPDATNVFSTLGYGRSLPISGSSSYQSGLNLYDLYGGVSLDEAGFRGVRTNVSGYPYDLAPCPYASGIIMHIARTRAFGDDTFRRMRVTTEEVIQPVEKTFLYRRNPDYEITNPGPYDYGATVLRASVGDIELAPGDILEFDSLQDACVPLEIDVTHPLLPLVDNTSTNTKLRIGNDDIPLVTESFGPYTFRFVANTDILRTPTITVPPAHYNSTSKRATVNWPASTWSTTIPSYLIPYFVTKGGVPQYTMHDMVMHLTFEIPAQELFVDTDFEFPYSDPGLGFNAYSKPPTFIKMPGQVSALLTSAVLNYNLPSGASVVEILQDPSDPPASFPLYSTEDIQCKTSKDAGITGVRVRLQTQFKAFNNADDIWPQGYTLALLAGGDVIEAGSDRVDPTLFSDLRSYIALRDYTGEGRKQIGDWNTFGFNFAYTYRFNNYLAPGSGQNPPTDPLCRASPFYGLFSITLHPKIGYAIPTRINAWGCPTDTAKDFYYYRVEATPKDLTLVAITSSGSRSYGFVSTTGSTSGNNYSTGITGPSRNHSVDANRTVGFELFDPPVYEDSSDWPAPLLAEFQRQASARRTHLHAHEPGAPPIVNVTTTALPQLIDAYASEVNQACATTPPGPAIDGRQKCLASAQRYRSLYESVIGKELRLSEASSSGYNNGETLYWTITGTDDYPGHNPSSWTRGVYLYSAFDGSDTVRFFAQEFYGPVTAGTGAQIQPRIYYASVPLEEYAFAGLMATINAEMAAYIAAHIAAHPITGIGSWITSWVLTGSLGTHTTAHVTCTQARPADKMTYFYDYAVARTFYQNTYEGTSGTVGDTNHVYGNAEILVKGQYQGYAGLFTYPSTEIKDTLTRKTYINPVSALNNFGSYVSSVTPGGLELETTLDTHLMIHNIAGQLYYFPASSEVLFPEGKTWNDVLGAFGCYEIVDSGYRYIFGSRSYIGSYNSGAAGNILLNPGTLKLPNTANNITNTWYNTWAPGGFDHYILHVFEPPLNYTQLPFLTAFYDSVPAMITEALGGELSVVVQALLAGPNPRTAATSGAVFTVEFPDEP